MNIEHFHTNAESVLVRALEISKGLCRIEGVHSVASLAFLIAQVNSREINILPHLVVVDGFHTANLLAKSIQTFEPTKQVSVLAPHDVSPYSGLYSSQKFVAQRLQFLQRASTSKPGEVFIAPIDALLQRVIPYSIFVENTFSLRVGEELPGKFAEKLQNIGYAQTPIVEDTGQFAIRGGIVDIYSPAFEQPVRIELFGDQIERMFLFSPTEQRRAQSINEFTVSPAKEVIYSDESHDQLIENFRASVTERISEVNKADYEEVLRSLSLCQYFPGVEFLLPYFYKKTSSVLDYFNSELTVWRFNQNEILTAQDQFFSELKSDFTSATAHTIRPELSALYLNYSEIEYPLDSKRIEVENLTILETPDEATKQSNRVEFKTYTVENLIPPGIQVGTEVWRKSLSQKISTWLSSGYKIFVSSRNASQQERLNSLFSDLEFSITKTGADDRLWDTWIHDRSKVHLLTMYLPEKFRIEGEKIIFLRDEDFFGKRSRSDISSVDAFNKKAKSLSFGDLKISDYVVHVKHGIGVFDGLKIMNINNTDSEYIQISYKEGDKLYLPVYNVAQLQKYAGASATISLDKLGGAGWQKTKVKVKNHVRDVAADLLALYAAREKLIRPSYALDSSAVQKFSDSFPFEETEDQMRAINDIQMDFVSTKPMDRLICGDVGFGKTEVAMRAAFFAASSGKQVAILAPTTVLTFQHHETFKTRFKDFSFKIKVINRFISNSEAKQILAEIKSGEVHIIIGTHRLLSKDVEFANLGLLIIDEEQKFGVVHKEKIKKLKNHVDTLTLSATPIPRTLNMSLMGVRDLSLINSAPVDRLPTRTFITRFDAETIRRAIESEISRGGQVYFIHNRVQSIYGVADELKQIVPNARIRVGHGQMEEHELEKTMVAFFHHEIDVLVCTTIVESGMDVPRANTMFIDESHTFGLSQLYQLRGRVGRSKQRAYCYLILPKSNRLEKDQQERLKIIQENSELGSGIKIAQYDLELRGGGNILGESQSGHMNAVGYELYMDLLSEALAEAKGEKHTEIELEPEINLKIPALIPSDYISDIRVRLGYYKALAEIKSPGDLNVIESEVEDLYGKLPEQVVNLMGLMLIRLACRELGVRDISAGVKNISLVFTEKTRLKPEVVIGLAMKENKKYSLTPDNRLNIRMNSITWSNVYNELEYLLKL